MQNIEGGILSLASPRCSRLLAVRRQLPTIAQGGKTVPPQAFRAKGTTQHYALPMGWSQVAVNRQASVDQRIADKSASLDPSIVKVSVYWNDAEDEVSFAGLQGQLVRDLRPMARLWVNVTATKNGQTQSNSANISARQGIDWYTEERLQALAKQAVERTMVLFEARRPPAGKLPVVLAAGASGILLHQAIGHGMEADFNRKNTSIYAEMLGKQVAPDFVTIVDDGRNDHERGALPATANGARALRCDCRRANSGPAHRAMKSVQTRGRTRKSGCRL